MLVEYEYDPKANTYTPISQEIVKDSKTVKTGIEEDVARAKREDNKIILNNKAMQSLKISSGDSVSVRYKQYGKITIPVIGKDSDLECKNGNKVTKTNSISCRGKSNDVLADYGTDFELVPDDKSGIFKLIDKKVYSDIELNAEDDNISELYAFDFGLELTSSDGDSDNFEITDEELNF